MSDLISIGIPVYNCDRFLEEALKSIANQTYQNLEIIIVDNNSHDGTKNIIDKFTHDTRIKYFKNNTTICLADNFDRAFKLSTAEYFLWVSCDDIWDATFIEKAYKILQQNPDLIGVCSDIKNINDEGNAIAQYQEPTFEIVNPPHWTHYHCLYRRNILLNTQLNSHPGIYDFILLNEIAIQGPRAIIKEKLYIRRSVFKNKEIAKRICHPIEFWWTITARGYIESINRYQKISEETKKQYKKHIKNFIMTDYHKKSLLLENKLQDHELESFIDKYIMNPYSKIPQKNIKELPAKNYESPVTNYPKKNSKKKKKKSQFIKNKRHIRNR